MGGWVHSNPPPPKPPRVRACLLHPLAKGSGFPTISTGQRFWVFYYTPWTKVLDLLLQLLAKGSGFPTTPTGQRLWVSYYNYWPKGLGFLLQLLAKASGFPTTTAGSTCWGSYTGQKSWFPTTPSGRSFCVSYYSFWPKLLGFLLYM